MDRLKKTRSVERSRMTRLANECNTLLATDSPDVEKLCVTLEVMKPISESLDALNQKIMDLMLDADSTEDEMNAETIGVDGYSKTFVGLKLKVEKLLTPLVSPGPASEYGSVLDAEGNKKRNFKLPKIELKTFNGDLKEWLGFWSQFTKIHEDETLHATDKFQYLIQAMENGSEAKDIVQSYPSTAENYPKAVKALEERYGDNALLLQVYVREILQLVTTNGSSKDKLPLPKLYLKLESHLRALHSLRLREADPDTWLYPLVESSINEEVLIAWQRSPLSTKDGSSETPPKTRLNYLMEFLGTEVQMRQKISLAKTGFQIEDKKSSNSTTNQKINAKIPTLSGMHSKPQGCIFCSKAHESKDCFHAQNMKKDELMQIIKDKKHCFSCVKPWLGRTHKCWNKLKCMLCNGPHVTLMCDKRLASTSIAPSPIRNQSTEQMETNSASSSYQCKEVILQTLIVNLRGPKGMKRVRVFLDNGSSRSSILKTTAMELGLEPIGSHTTKHALYGGYVTNPVKHKIFNVAIHSAEENCFIQIEVRDESEICKNIPRVSGNDSRIIRELKSKQIWISDIGEKDLPIEVLIGSDYYGELLTGDMFQLSCGLTAMHTKLGWTLSGLVKNTEQNAVEMVINTANRDISDLWNLEVIGIQDPIEVQTIKAQEAEVKEKLLQTLERKPDGRYVVGLPWKLCHPYLPSNREVAYKRLLSTSRMLQRSGNFSDYSKLFQQWEEEGFIEEVHGNGSDHIGLNHYLPHRPVFKESSSTTPVRPVFDASCKVGSNPSLNDCLEKGPSYIQLITDILLRFREKRFAAVSDIRKAFQMIEVSDKDRNALRFLWWTDENMETIKEYRHVRVPFGATCSPFILGAVIEYHLDHVQEEDKKIALLLKQSLFVDNCVVSLDTEEEYHNFKKDAIRIMSDAKMELRMWMSNLSEDVDKEKCISVLGVSWNRANDTLLASLKPITVPERITKRTILSVAQQVFDPIGFTIPARIPLKILLQKAWMEKTGWDEDMPQNISQPFLKWCHEMESLAQIAIPRRFCSGERDTWSLHCFTDASKDAYASVVYLKSLGLHGAMVQLLGANSRVAPIKPVTIPRLELMSCLIGSRLLASIKSSLVLESVPVFYYNDSSTAIAWITRKEEWSVFVRNRVKEIRALTKDGTWSHLPGIHNPADLPSRGCFPNELCTTSWWDGPTWLKDDITHWPVKVNNPDEKEVAMEKIRSQCPKEASMCAMELSKYDRTFPQLVRIYSWILRYIFNSSHPTKKTGELSEEEKEYAEMALLKKVQNEMLSEDCLKGVPLFRDADGVLRLKTRLGLRNDTFNFMYPIVLPRDHPIIWKLVCEKHLEHGHASDINLLNKLREKYWIIGARKIVTSVKNNCYRCRRLVAKNLQMEPPPLPLDRIKDADIFETVGVDLAGPLFLINQKKVWIVIFTCAVYRAIHLELVTSISTMGFIGALENFIRVCRRPVTIFCDNGTNFRGTDNLFKSMDWNKIQKEDNVERIKFRFSAPTASWWGGFWERLIRMMKDIMKRMIGKATLKKKELELVLLKVKDIMNSRPLTFMSDDPESPRPLTPSLFLRNTGLCEFPEGLLSEGEKMRIRWNYLEKLREELKQRFRSEYLSELVSKTKTKPTRPIRVGEIVLVGSDLKKRLEWPLGKVLELIPGCDGKIRTASIKTQYGTFIRPVQRLFPLELDWEDVGDGEKTIGSIIRTKSGRIVKTPDRFGRTVGTVTSSKAGVYVGEH